MNSILTQVLYFIASYIGLFIVLMGSLNWLTKGFLLSFLKVKASQGKKILSRVSSRTDYYFTTGRFIDGAYHFKSRDKRKNIIADVPDNAVYSMCGVFALDHSENGKVIYFNGLDVQNLTGHEIDNYVNRIIKAPQVDDNRFKIMFIILALILVIALASAYFGYVNYDKLVSMELTGVIQ